MKKISTNRLDIILLLGAILVGGFLRIWKIGSLPFPPSGDELFFGYYGWSLLNYQTDEFGNSLPYNFISIGDFKYPGLAYLNIIPAAIFGLSKITTRFWSVTSGILLIPIIYFLALMLFRKRSIALVSAWLIALSPWSITMSRIGYENHLAMMFTTLAITLLVAQALAPNLKGWEGRFLSIFYKSKRRMYITFSFSVILLILSSFTYAAQRVFIPIMLVSLLILTFIKKSKLRSIRKYILISLVITSLVIALSLIPQESRGRASSEAWTQPTETEEAQLIEFIAGAGYSPTKIPVIVTRAFNNKVRVGITSYLERYTAHFSPDFLFFKGEASFEGIPGIGQLLLIELVFVLFGLLLLFTNPSLESSLFVLFWLLIAPIASALTIGMPHINRSSIMIPALAILSGYGFWKIITIFNKRLRPLVTLLLIVCVITSSLFALNQIFVQKPVYRAWYGEQVNETLVEELYKVKDNYDSVVLPKDEFIFFLFYKKIPPDKFVELSDIKPFDINEPWDRVERLENINFKMPFDCPKSGKLNTLYVCKGLNVPQNSTIINSIRYFDGVPAYTFIEFYPQSQMPTPLPKLPRRYQYMVDLETFHKFPDGIIPQDYPSLW